MIEKNKFIILPIAIITGLFALYFGLGFYDQPRTDLFSEEEAIKLVRNKHPEVSSFGWGEPIFNAENIANEWYVSVAFQGSGLPIIGGQCFRVNYNKEVSYISEMVSGPLTIKRINPVNCQAE